MTAPSLLVLAAGMGSRYGGLKQMDPIGPSGEWLLEYSVRDAWRAGFRDIVFVIRRDFSTAFCDALRQRLPEEIRWRVVYQDMARVPAGASAPAGREKPLGTGHAIWCAAPEIDRPFAVINADDFYGAQAYQLLAGWLQQQARPDRHALVAYALRNTLSPHGHVSRGVCEVADGFLRKVTEITRIECDGEHGVATDAAGGTRRIAGDTPVSMNLWGFHPAIFPRLEDQLRRFLAGLRDPLKDEFYIPSAVDDLVASAQARVAVLRTGAEWLGVTYPADRERVRAGIARLCAGGAYPAPLWGGLH